jgi:hypothetical protein
MKTEVPDVLMCGILSQLSETELFKDIVPKNFLCHPTWKAESWSNRQHYLTRINRGVVLWQMCRKTQIESFMGRSMNAVHKILADLADQSQVSISRVSAMIIFSGMHEFQQRSYDDSLLLLSACGHDAALLTNYVSLDMRAKGRNMRNSARVESDTDLSSHGEVEEKLQHGSVVNAFENQNDVDREKIESLEVTISEVQQNMGAINDRMDSLQTSVNSILALLLKNQSE